MNQTTKAQADRTDEPRYLALARAAALSRLTREQVITALLSRIRRATSIHPTRQNQVDVLRPGAPSYRLCSWPRSGAGTALQ